MGGWSDGVSTLHRNFSPSQVGTEPILISIDGGVDQTQDTGFNFNGESDLDLEYAFGPTNPQPILPLQTGDIPECASFDNWLDAVDGSFCTFEGGDDPTQVRAVLLLAFTEAKLASFAGRHLSGPSSRRL